MAELQHPQPPVLQRHLFTETLHLKALRIPKKQCLVYMNLLKGYTFDRPRLRCILPEDGHPETRLLLLADTVQDEGLAEVDEEIRNKVLQDNDVQVVPYDLILDYSYWPADHILKRLLPEGCEVPTSFESVGHIAHVNLKDELLPYKHIIGQVLLDKNPTLRTIVNKVGSIENEFRVFQMDVIAGDSDLVTEVKQHKARFRLDYGEVYWNSRLEHEHRRLVDTFTRGQTIVDMMAGIGPFALPAAQKGCTVYANDLNPRSHHWLEVNIRLNKVDEHVRACCMDARAFLRLLCDAVGPSSSSAADPNPATLQSTSSGLSEQWSVPSGGLHFDHVIMNLPASAVEFLDVFGGCFNEDRWRDRPLPTIHCYTFARAAETDADIRSRAEALLGGQMTEGCRVHLVRDVAPNKRMFCLSFQLPRAIAFGLRLSSEDAALRNEERDGNACKRQRRDAGDNTWVGDAPNDNI